VIAGLEPFDTLAYLLDHPRALMSEDPRHGAPVDAVHLVPVRTADAARSHPHEHLAGPRRVQLELLDDERCPVLVLHGGAHARSIAHEGLAPLPDVGTPVPEGSPISGRRGTSDLWGQEHNS